MSTHTNITCLRLSSASGRREPVASLDRDTGSARAPPARRARL